MSLGLLAIDLGKRSFHVYGVDSDGLIVSRKLSRVKLLISHANRLHNEGDLIVCVDEAWRCAQTGSKDAGSPAPPRCSSCREGRGALRVGPESSSIQTKLSERETN
jgi:hypothetical protein